MAKAYLGLFALAIALLVVGFGLVDHGLPLRWGPVQGEERFEIPAGPWHSFVPLELGETGHVMVEFQAEGEGTVTAFLLSAEAYAIYQETGIILLPLESASGSAGTLDARVPEAGTYYLVFVHGPGHGAEAQEVLLRYRVAGIPPPSVNWALTVAGAAALALGVGTATVAAHRWQRGRGPSRGSNPA